MSGECLERVFPGCGRIVVCREGLRERLGPGVLRRFRYLSPGQVSNSVDLEGDTAYYIYVGPGGAGFYVEASLRGLAAGECGPRMRSELVPLIEDALRGDPRLPAVLMIVSERMLS